MKFHTVLQEKGGVKSQKFGLGFRPATLVLLCRPRFQTKQN